MSRKTEPSHRLDARIVAAEVLERVHADSAYGAAALQAVFDRYPALDERGRAQVTELVYTTLRSKKSLLTRLESYAPKGLPNDAVFLSHLLVAATQILLLDHRTLAIAVDVAVSQIGARRGKPMSGFANAILRKLVQNRDSFDRASSIRSSCPTWLWEALENTVGRVEASLLLGIETEESGKEKARERHPIALRVRSAGDVPAWLSDCERGRYSPLCRLVSGLGDPRTREGYREGRFVVQEEGAQLIALALGAKSGERILDVCAGRGQKTTLLAEQVGATGFVCATDLHQKKLDALAAEFQRLGLPVATTAATDWSRGSGGMTELFDRVLVDAPCTGTGTLRKRPEIAARLTPTDPSRLAELQSAILRNAALCLKPEGSLVYAVCSVLPEECEAVVESVADVLAPIAFEVEQAVQALGEGAQMGRLLPGRHGTDGYFMARFARRNG